MNRMNTLFYKSTAKFNAEILVFRAASFPVQDRTNKRLVSLMAEVSMAHDTPRLPSLGSLVRVRLPFLEDGLDHTAQEFFCE